MENSFASLVDSAVSILVLLPVKPTFDQVTAGLSLYLSIHETKEVGISCPSPMTVGFNRIIGINKISSELGNKNLTIKFKGYDANNIEKVSYDIVGGEFNLTVVPKVGFSAPSQDQMDLSFSGVSADLVILIGGANDSDFPVLESPELTSSKIANISNRSLSSAREVLSFSKSGATVSEVVANLIKDNGMSMDPDIATDLVMGIEEGSSNFASPEVTPDTFEMFAYLLRNGAQRSPRTKLSPASFPAGSIPTQPFGTKVSKVLQVPQNALEEPLPKAGSPEPSEAIENKEEVVENPPDDWLQPKVFKGSTTPQATKSDSFSENKG